MPVTTYAPKCVPLTYDIAYNSPLRNPKTCPTHIDVQGYGRLPIQVAQQSFWSSKITQIVPDVMERILHVRPVDMGGPTPPHRGVPLRVNPLPSVTVMGLAAVTIGAAMFTAGWFCSAPAAPILIVLGLLVWTFGILACWGNAHIPDTELAVARKH